MGATWKVNGPGVWKQRSFSLGLTLGATETANAVANPLPQGNETIDEGQSGKNGRRKFNIAIQTL